MTKYTVTFVIETDDNADPSSILDAAHECGEDLQAHLEAVGITAAVDEEETSVQEKDDG